MGAAGDAYPYKGNVAMSEQDEALPDLDLGRGLGLRGSSNADGVTNSEAKVKQAISDTIKIFDSLADDEPTYGGAIEVDDEFAIDSSSFYEEVDEVFSDPIEVDDEFEISPVAIDSSSFYEDEFADTEVEEYEDFYGVMMQNDKGLQSHREGGRQLASSSFDSLGTAARSVSGDPETNGAWQGAAVGGSVLLGCLSAAAVVGAATAGVGGIMMGAMCPFASLLASLSCDNCFGTPKNDDANMMVKVADQNYADGNALCFAFHRSNHETDRRCMGFIKRGEEKDKTEDLDAAHLWTLEIYINDVDDVCVEGMAIELGPEPSGTGRTETLVLDGGVLAYMTSSNRNMYRGNCLWIGDWKNSLTNMKINWPSALRCRDNFYAHTSADFGICMKRTVKYLTYSDGSRKLGWNFGSGNLPSSMKFPYKTMINRRNYFDFPNPFEKNPNPGLGLFAIDLSNANTKNGSRIVYWPSHGGANQKWHLGDDGRIRSVLNPSKCLEAGKNGDLYAKAFIWDCNNASHQQWTLQNGRLRNRHHGMYLGIAWCGEKLHDKSKRWVELRHYEDGGCGSAQRWGFFS